MRWSTSTQHSPLAAHPQTSVPICSGQRQNEFSSLAPPARSRYRMTQFSVMYGSPGPQPRAESRQSAGDDLSVLEKRVESPRPEQTPQTSSGSPTRVAPGISGGQEMKDTGLEDTGRRSLHGICLHLASQPSSVPGQLNEVCSCFCKAGNTEGLLGALHLNPD